MLHCKHCSETFESTLTQSQQVDIDKLEGYLEKSLADICKRLGEHLAKEHPAQHALMTERVMQAVGLCTWLSLIGNHTMWLDAESTPSRFESGNGEPEDYIMEQVDANIDKVHELIGFNTYLADDEEELEDDELDYSEDDKEDEETEDLEEIKG